MEVRAHQRVMARALALASRGVGDTSPNPAVGAVVVKGSRVVGEGYHRRAGLPHAELEALRRAGAAARGATLYVTLEPCNHTGRTPPCCDAIVAAGIRRVVVAMRDPNPRVRGGGLVRLRRAGIDVVEGVRREEAERLNAPFLKAVTRRLPWVVAKVAQSLDGKIATTAGESRWITSAPARAVGHRLRRNADAVMVGINTVLRDDPLLTARDPRRPARSGRPVKVIVDSHLRTPLDSRCLSKASPAPAIIATTERSVARRRRFERRGVRVLVFPPRRGRVPLARLLRTLVAEHEVQSVLLEGGGELFAGALRERLVDRIVCGLAPILIGGQAAPGAVGGEGISRLSQAIRLDGLAVAPFGSDLLIEAGIVYPGPVRRAPR